MILKQVPQWTALQAIKKFRNGEMLHSVSCLAQWEEVKCLVDLKVSTIEWLLVRLIWRELLREDHYFRLKPKIRPEPLGDPSVPLSLKCNVNDMKLLLTSKLARTYQLQLLWRGYMLIVDYLWHSRQTVKFRNGRVEK